MEKRVLITDAVHPILIEKLENEGFIVDYKTDFTNKNVYEFIHIYTGIIINSKIQLDKKVITKAKNLKFIGRLGSGMEIIDVEFAEKQGIKCYNSPEGNRDAVAEHAIGMLLSLFNKLNKSNQEVKNFSWKREENRGIELKGKTVGLLGFGNTGKAMARKLSGFDVTVLVYDKYLKNYGNEFAKESSIQEIQENADILSIHLPLTNETIGFFDYPFISKFKKSFYLINTARGKIVPTIDLIESLEQKKIKGACLDVFENENPSNYSQKEKMTFTRLFQFENVLVSSHVAGWTVESKKKLSLILAEKILFRKNL